MSLIWRIVLSIVVGLITASTVLFRGYLYTGALTPHLQVASIMIFAVCFAYGLWKLPRKEDR
jgi:flagellar motor component MotA